MSRTKAQLRDLASAALRHGYYADPDGSLRVGCPLCPEHATGRREYRWFNVGPGKPYSRADPDTGRPQRFGQETVSQALRRIILAHLDEEHRDQQ